jgi:hypothetical protein
MYNQLKKLVKKRTTDNISSYTLIQKESDTVKQDPSIAKSIAAEMVRLESERQHKWTCQDKMMCL